MEISAEEISFTLYERLLLKLMDVVAWLRQKKAEMGLMVAVSLALDLITGVLGGMLGVAILM
jgi:hypothetical protein